MCRGRGLKPHAIGERSEIELCTLCCASFRMLVSNCIMSLYSSISCASINRKNKTHNHTKSNRMTRLRRFVIIGMTNTFQGRVELSLENQARAILCQETLSAKKGIFKGSLKASSRQWKILKRKWHCLMWILVKSLWTKPGKSSTGLVGSRETKRL